MKFNFQIIENANEDGTYTPDYELLKSNATCQEEVDYIERVASRGATFTFNMVYVMKMACGHFEIFQHPAVSKTEALEWLNMISQENMKCTRCVCNWNKQEV